MKQAWPWSEGDQHFESFLLVAKSFSKDKIEQHPINPWLNQRDNRHLVEEESKSVLFWSILIHDQQTQQRNPHLINLISDPRAQHQMVMGCVKAARTSAST